MAETRIGKKQSSTTITIFGFVPNPIQTRSSGASATFGTALIAGDQRMVIRSTAREAASRTATAAHPRRRSRTR